MIPLERVESDVTLPRRTGVVVIGGGVIGVATAMELRQRGIAVVVVEKGEIAGEQSGRNWGWVRQQGRDAREVALAKIAMEKWRGMNALVAAETGYRQPGIAYLSYTEKDLAWNARWHERHARAFDLKTRLLSAAEAEALVPGGRRKPLGALYTPDDGKAEPFMAVPAMARQVRRMGAKVFTHCAARGLETAAGRVSAVVTEKGTIACDAVVLAAGAWSRRFLGNLGIRFPQLTVINSVGRSKPLDAGHDVTFLGGRFAARKRLDGGYTVAHNIYSVASLIPDSFRLVFDFLPLMLSDMRGVKVRLGKRFFDEARLARRWRLDETSPFEQVRMLDPMPYPALIHDAAKHLRANFPGFAGLEIAEIWAGAIDVTPDAVPVMEELPQQKGLFLASGFSGHGFGLGPAAGQLMAELVTGETPCVDPRPFRLGRYVERPRPRPDGDI
ncbi:MAG TPA: FAD-binding oxidoreductase [Aestuariivirga sp.]|nr:FAD-binding oxidoreductase [Aestuariivirga sp.]